MKLSRVKDSQKTKFPQLGAYLKFKILTSEQLTNQKEAELYFKNFLMLFAILQD